MNFPQELRYTKEHEWVRTDAEATYVGITDFAQSELGDIVYVDINTIGQEIKAGEVFGTVEAVKTVSDLFMPITGTILAANDTLNTSPDLVNSDPYQKGWIVKIKVSAGASEEFLMSSVAYTSLIGK